MGPTWGPPWSCRPQMGPMLAPWTLLSGLCSCCLQHHEFTSQLWFNITKAKWESTHWFMLAVPSCNLKMLCANENCLHLPPVFLSGRNNCLPVLKAVHKAQRIKLTTRQLAFEDKKIRKFLNHWTGKLKYRRLWGFSFDLFHFRYVNRSYQGTQNNHMTQKQH